MTRDDGGTGLLSRRLVLGTAGIVLLAACDSTSGRPLVRASLPGDSHPSDPPPPTAAPPTAAPATSAPPSPTPKDIGPTHAPDAAPPAGKPQFYITEGPTAIALTVDDGPDPTFTPQVLKLLEKYQVTATFCMVGKRVAANPRLVRAVASAGHLIATHTMTHANLKPLALPAVRTEIEHGLRAVERAKGGAHPQLFRAPFGNWSPIVFSECQRLGLRPLDWSVDPRDWSRPGVPHIVNTVVSQTKTGSIILEHDGGGDRSQTVAALSQFIPRLLDAGFHFVTP